MVGGGDAALQEALHLTGFCRSVTLVVRGRRLRARADYVARAADNARMAFRWQSEVSDVFGDDGVDSVRLRQVGAAGTEDLACRAVFVQIGQESATAFLGDLVARDDTGAVITAADGTANVAGVFAAGLVRAGFPGLLVNAAADGAQAALAAHAWLAERGAG